MSSAKGKLVRMLGGLFLRRATIVEAAHVGAFRRLVLRGDVPTPRAGTKVQVLLPSDDVRTYSPIAGEGGFTLLGWTRAGGPGARWLAEVERGAEVRFVGPQGSLDLPAGRVVVVGDETSVAVAASYAAARPGHVHAVLQASAVDDVRAAAGAVDLRADVFGADDRVALVDAVVAAHASDRDTILALTGGSELVVAVRAALRERGLRDVKTKTYWIPGKVGLD